MSDGAALWARLANARLVAGEMPQDEPSDSPWFVRAMLGIAGWIGAWFLLGFLGAIFVALFKSGVLSLVLGAGACVVAWFIDHRFAKNDFVAQFGLATSLAGQVLVGFGLFDLLGSSRFKQAELSPAFIAFAVFEVVLAVAMQSTLHRTWSAFAAALAFWQAGSGWNVAPIASALLVCIIVALADSSVRIADRRRAWQVGVALAALAAAAVAAIPDFFGFAVSRSAGLIWGSRALEAAACAYLVTMLLHRDDGDRMWIWTIAILAILACMPVAGLSVALVVLVVGFAGGRRAMFGLGVLGMIATVGLHYYRLDSSLLMKAALMAGTGIALLAVHALIGRGRA